MANLQPDGVVGGLGKNIAGAGNKRFAVGREQQPTKDHIGVSGQGADHLPGSIVPQINVAVPVTDGSRGM
jgi:hypothetical protein